MQPTARDLVSIQCSICGEKIRLGDHHCTSCGREVTKDEIDALRRRLEASDPEAARRSDDVAYGRAALLVVAGLAFVEAMVYGLLGESVRTFAFCIAISGCMVALFFWGRRQPLVAMVVGAAVYLALQAIAALVSVETLTQGVVIKVLVVTVMIGGISAELRRRKLERELTGR
jgi:hypothetical protein